MLTNRSLRILVVFSCAMMLGVLPVWAQGRPPRAEAVPTPTSAPVVEQQGQNLSVAEPGRNIEAGFFLGGLIGGDLANVVTGDFSLANSFENGRTYGGRVGYYTFPLGVEGSFAQSENGLSGTVALADVATDLTARVRYVEANVVFFLIPGPVQPFVTGGGGRHSYMLSDLGGLDIDKWGWNYGGGLKINVSRVSLRADLRDHVTTVDGAGFGIDPETVSLLGLDAEKLHNVELTFGAGFRF